MKKQTVLWTSSVVLMLAGLGSFTSAQIVPGIAAFIAGIALLPPLGGVLTGAMGKTGAIVLRSAVVVVGLVVLAATIKPEQGQGQPAQTAQGPATTAQATTPEGRIAGMVQSLRCKPIKVELVEQVRTEWTDEQVKRLQAGEDISAGTGKFLAKIAYENPEGLSAKNTRYALNRRAMETTRELSTKPEYSNIVSIMLMPHLNLVDKYGNASMEQVGKFSLTREVAQKIQWDNMDEDRFASIVQSDGQLWLHPAMR